MNKHLITALQVIVVTGFIGLGIANIVKTNHKVKLQDIQLKSKQSDLIQLEGKFDLLNKELERKDLDVEKAKQLEQEKLELQKQLDAALQAKATKAAQIAAEKQKLATAASSALGQGTASAATGSVEQIVREAAVRYGINPDYFAGIARCESTFNPNIVNYNYNENGNPTGLFQHLSGYWPARAANYGYAGASIYDATAQANVTAQMFRDGLQGLWECK